MWRVVIVLFQENTEHWIGPYIICNRSIQLFQKWLKDLRKVYVSGVKLTCWFRVEVYVTGSWITLHNSYSILRELHATMALGNIPSPNGLFAGQVRKSSETALIFYSFFARKTHRGNILPILTSLFWMETSISKLNWVQLPFGEKNS